MYEDDGIRFLKILWFQIELRNKDIDGNEICFIICKHDLIRVPDFDQILSMLPHFRYSR